MPFSYGCYSQSLEAAVWASQQFIVQDPLASRTSAHDQPVYSVEVASYTLAQQEILPAALSVRAQLPQIILDFQDAAR